LSILNAIAEALNREIDLTRALDTALSRIVELFGLHTGWIWLLSEQTGEFYLAAALNLPPVLTEKPHRMEGWCHCRESYEEGEMSGAANINIIQCTRLKGLIKGTDGLRAHASVPLYAHGKPLGILNVVSGDWRELTPNELRLLYTVGDLLSIAIERARLFMQSAQVGALEERNRLAREIHDTLAQGFSAIALQLESADALLEAGADRAKIAAIIGRTLELTRANLDEARRSVMDLRAAPLEGQTLHTALAALITAQTAGTGIVARIELDRNPPPLPQGIEIGLYRIAQEALTNILHHANAKRISVELVTQVDQIRLTIEDDGRGFDPAAVPTDRFGLIGINERARLLGGEANLASAPGEGTCLRIRLPLRRKT
jgi:two-component system NarL family sensor kinase